MTDKHSPQLKFSNTNWKRVKLGDLYTERKEKGNDSLPILSVSIHTGISDKEMKPDSLGKTVNRSEDKSLYKHIYQGDLVLNMMRAWQGAYGVSKVEGMVSPAYITAYPNAEVFPTFMNYYLKRESIISQINNLSYGVTDFRKRLYWGSFVKVSCLLPPIIDQEKITNFFEHLESVISLHQQELDALKQTKQGFLQKMFPKDQELIPKMRLSGFEGKWIEMKFKNLAKIRRGLTYKPKDVDRSGVRVLRSSNIKSDSFILKDDDVFVKQEVVNINYAKENEILITSANGSSNLVGKHALIKKLNSPTVHGGFMLIASAKTPYFVNTLMSTEWYDRFIKVHVSGGNGAIGNLNKNSLENYSVIVPSIEEQVKIGEFFRQLDEVIELKEQELEALNQTKKGFLQKMFV